MGIGKAGIVYRRAIEYCPATPQQNWQFLLLQCVACYCRKLGVELWEGLPCAEAASHSAALVEALLQEVQHPAEQVQRAAASALAHLVQRNGPDAAEIVLQHLQDIFDERLPVCTKLRIVPAIRRAHRDAKLSLARKFGKSYYSQCPPMVVTRKFRHC